MEMEESEVSRIFPNEEFGYWKVTVLQPLLDESGRPQHDKKGKLIPIRTKPTAKVVPFTYEGGIDAFMEKEVRPYAPDAWVDEKKTQIGYELSFTKYFYKPVELRPLAKSSPTCGRLSGKPTE
jgi:type I restriction enzyme M protein